MADTDDMSPTYCSISEWMASRNDSSLFGYTLGTLRMILNHPYNETMRQQGLDIIRAVDDHDEREAAR